MAEIRSKNFVHLIEEHEHHKTISKADCCKQD